MFCYKWVNLCRNVSFRTNNRCTCNINHSGSAGSMEASGAVEMFLRSIDKHGLIYKIFVGDGDSSSYGKVKERCLQEFGEIYDVEKEECVGHIQKRLGTALREYKRKNKGKVLSDGGKVGGKNRLTGVAIDKMQNNFGFAIRNNVGDKKKMNDAIWAVYHHSIKNSEEPFAAQHRYCPTSNDTWCKYWTSLKNTNIEYTESKRLPEAFLVELKPIFDRLTSDALLNRCLKGLTQNQNESLNGLLWSICPKIRFCGKEKLESCVCEAVNRFNTGAHSSAELLEMLQINPGRHMLEELTKEDSSRVKVAERKVSGHARVQRQKLRSRKKKNVDTISYNPGSFGLTSEPEINSKPAKKKRKLNLIDVNNDADFYVSTDYNGPKLKFCDDKDSVLINTCVYLNKAF